MDINNVTQSLRIREYYYMMLRHKLVFVLVITISTFIAAIVAFSMPKIYRAQTVLMVEAEQILNPLIHGLAISPSARARLRTMREQLLSWPRLTLLAEKMGMADSIDSPIEYEKMISRLRKSITVKLRGNDLVTVSFDGPDPKKAQDIVLTLSDIIIKGSLTSANLDANSAIQFIQEQLDLYRERLEESETRLRKFRELYASTLPIATRMNEQLVQLKIELSNLLTQNTEKHPRVIHTREMIAQLEKHRDEQFQQAQIAGLDIDPEHYAKLVASAPLQDQELAKLRRDHAVNETMYQRLRQRLETAKLSQTLEESEKGMKFKVLEPARLPLTPVKPNIAMIIIAGAVIGMGLGLAIVYLIELSNNSIRNIDEARQLLDLPIFGAIATIKPEELLLGERLRAEVGV